MSYSYLIPKTDRIVWKARNGDVFVNNGKGLNQRIHKSKRIGAEVVDPDRFHRAVQEIEAAQSVTTDEAFWCGVILGVGGSFVVGVLAFVVAVVLA